MLNAKIIAAGVLPFFDDGKTVLLGREYRKRYNCYNWMEFGGKHEHEETLAETACREANEETAQTLDIKLEQVQEAEILNHYVDYYNIQTGVYYRMYTVWLDMKPNPELFKVNAVGKSNVEMVEWKYFNIEDVFNSVDGTLPGTHDKIYSTTCTRLAMLAEQYANSRQC